MIKTRSAFIYGFLVNYDNDTFVIFDGAYNTCKIKHGTYSFTEYGAAVQEAFNTYGSQVYTVIANRDQTLTISASSTFSIDPADTGAAISALPMIGITISNSGTSLTSDSQTGYRYTPQYYLQDYKSLDSNTEYKNTSVNESASGIIETIVYNSVRYMECNIKFITNTDMGLAGSIDTVTDGYEQANSFMEYCITKGKIEFVPDVTDFATYNTLILEKTRSNSNGLGYSLKEESDFKDVYQTGILKFREVV